MSLPFVGENWEGIVGSLFLGEKRSLANYRNPKTQITAKPCGLFCLL